MIQWHTLPDFPGYEINENFEVRNQITGEVLPVELANINGDGSDAYVRIGVENIGIIGLWESVRYKAMGEKFLEEFKQQPIEILEYKIFEIIGHVAGNVVNKSLDKLSNRDKIAMLNSLRSFWKDYQDNVGKIDNIDLDRASPETLREQYKLNSKKQK